MSTKAVSWVLHHVRVEPITKMILVSMAENADENGVCWPSQKTTAEKACTSVITVKRKIKYLEAEGVISVIRRKTGKHMTKNKYRLHLEMVFNLMDTPAVQASSDPDFEGITEIPSNSEPDQVEGIPEIPLKVSERDQQSVEGIPGDTFKGITGDTRNHHRTVNSSNSATTTGAAVDVFASKPPTTRQQVKMNSDWRPSPVTFEKLKSLRGIDPDFAEEQLAGFVLFHDGAEGRQGSFDSKFHGHVIHHHERLKSKPAQIPEDWQPDQVTLQRLRTAGVAVDFIWESATEFVMYWSESGRTGEGWNAKFFRNCLDHWRRVQSQTETGAGTRSLEAAHSRFTDRSWAEG